MEEATSSKFNINFVRDVFLIGEEHHAAVVRKLIKGFYFLHARAGKDAYTYREDAHFVIALADFTTPQVMQTVAKAFTGIESPFAHKLIYLVTPADMNAEQLLFSQEIGARFVCSGLGRNDQLRDYLKRVCVESHQVGNSLTALEDELETAYRHQDLEMRRSVIERLKALPLTEGVLRLLAMAHMHGGDLKRAENCLKRLLQLNPQQLWAANTLGKLFLRSGRGAAGMELLSKLSHFHELNGERLLTLGNALVQAGRTAEAQSNFQKGDRLTGGGDERFKEGLAKVKLADKDLTGAIACLAGRNFSDDVISFLNMRAIVSIRAGRNDEGLEYYKFALAGAGDDKLVRAKLLFNQGLAYARGHNLDKAQECFRESCTLGGPKFTRAKGPLEKVMAVIKNRGKAKTGELETVKLGDDDEWETLY